MEFDTETEDRLKRLVAITNRSLGQTKDLYVLCDCDFNKLAKAEEMIKNHWLFYCPGDKEELDKVLAMEEKTIHLSLKEFLTSL